MLPSPAVQTPSEQGPQPYQNQSSPSHFHLYPLVEKLYYEIETGSYDSLVSELKIRFENCQKTLNSMSGYLGSKHMTVDGQKRKLEESDKALDQRRLFYKMKIISHHKSKKAEEEKN